MRSRRPELHSADGLRVQARPRPDPLRSAGFKWCPNARRVMPGSRPSPKCATLVTQPLYSSIPPESCTGGPSAEKGRALLISRHVPVRQAIGRIPHILGPSSRLPAGSVWGHDGGVHRLPTPPHGTLQECHLMRILDRKIPNRFRDRIVYVRGQQSIVVRPAVKSRTPWHNRDLGHGSRDSPSVKSSRQASVKC